MKKITKIAMIFAVLFLIACPLFANGESETAKETNNGKTEITFWHFPFVHSVEGYESVSENFGDWEKFLAEEFMKENPDIIVNTELLPWEGGVDKINVAISGGNPPDLVFDYLGRSGGWYLQGASKSWDGIISEETEKDILPSFKKLYTINGKLHAIPGFAWSHALVINKGLLDKYGYEGPILNGPGKDFTIQEYEEFLTDIKNVLPEGYYPTGIGCGSEQGDVIWWGYFWPFGVKFFNEDGTTVSSSPELIAAYEWLLSLRDKGLIAPGIASNATADVMKLWMSGKIAVAGGSKSYADYITKGIKDGTLDQEDVTVAVPFPVVGNGKPHSTLGPTGFVLFTDDPKKQEAVAKFVEFQLQPEYWAAETKGAGQFPATKSVSDMNIYENDEFQCCVADMLNTNPAGDFYLSDPNYGKIRIALAASSQAVFSGMKTPEKAVADLLKEIKKINGK